MERCREGDIDDQWDLKGLFWVTKSRALLQSPRFEDSGLEIMGSQSFSPLVFAYMYGSILLECSIKILEGWAHY